MKETLKGTITEQNLRHFISIIKGTKKDKKFSKKISVFLKLLQLHELPKDLLETCLELFTVLYLKSDQVVQAVLLKDMTSVWQHIKNN